jgi:hypothetical protein
LLSAWNSSEKVNASQRSASAFAPSFHPVPREARLLFTLPDAKDELIRTAQLNDNGLPIIHRRPALYR